VFSVAENAKGKRITSIQPTQLMKPCSFQIFALMFILSASFGH